MIWLLGLILLTPYPWRLARAFLPQRENPNPPATWEQQRAKLAHENRCHELGERYFEGWDQPLTNGDRE